MMRRIADPTAYEHLRALQPINQFITLAAIGLGFSQFIFLWNFFRSLRHGKPAGKNPWNATTLEWIVASPPGHGNFEVTPRVYRGAYDYSVPGAPRDFMMQNEPEPSESSQGKAAGRKSVTAG
jgi:cytochrome c oxidase subunit 1